MTIRDFENGFRKPRPHNIAAIRQALEDAGIVFNVEGAPSLAALKVIEVSRPTMECRAAGREHKG
jgi:hypothetical protein